MEVLVKKNQVIIMNIMAKTILMYITFGNVLF